MIKGPKIENNYLDSKGDTKIQARMNNIIQMFHENIVKIFVTIDQSNESLESTNI